MIKNRTRRTLKKRDKRNSHISNKIQMIYMSSNNDRHPVARTCTSLQCTCRHFTSSHPNFTQRHFTTLHYLFIWLNPIQVSYRFISPHITTLYLTSLHFNFRRFSSHFISFHFTPFIIAFPTLYLKILGLQGKVPNASTGSRFQLLSARRTVENTDHLTLLLALISLQSVYPIRTHLLTTQNQFCSNRKIGLWTIPNQLIVRINLLGCKGNYGHGNPPGGRGIAINSIHLLVIAYYKILRNINGEISFT